MQVTPAGGVQVSLYGVSYSSFYVGSNGYITFGSPDMNYDGIRRRSLLPAAHLRVDG